MAFAQDKIHAVSCRLTIDYRMSESSGIGVYLRHLVPRVAEAHAFRITLLGGGTLPGVQRRELRAPIYSIREQLEIPARAPRSTDVFWAPNYNAPFVSPGRLIVTVHDVNHLALPE